MAQHISGLIAQYGLLLIFAGVLAEQIGLPFSALPVLFVAGALAVAHQLSLAGALAVSIAACLLADLVWFGAGRHFGTRVMRMLCRISLSPDSCVHQSELRFDRWQGRILMVAKFVPGLSLVAPPLAGALGLRVREFVLFDGVGSLLWSSFGLGVGYLFSAQIDRLLMELHAFGKIALGLVLGLFALYLLVKWWRRRRLRVALRMPRISVDELRQAIESGRPPVIMDVRSAASRRLDPCFISGALLADPADVDRAVHDVPRDRELVTYCNCPNEATSARAAKALAAHHFRHVRPLQGGLLAWEDAQYPVQCSPAASDADRK